MSYFDIPREYKKKFEIIIDRLVNKYKFIKKDEAHRICYTCCGIDDMDEIIDVYNAMSKIMEMATEQFKGKSYDVGMTVIDNKTNTVILTNLGDERVNRWILHTCCCQCYIKYNWSGTYDYASKETKEKIDEYMSQLKLLGFEPIGVDEDGIIVGSNTMTEDMMEIARYIVLAISSTLKKHVREMNEKHKMNIEEIRVDMVPWKL